MDCLTVCIALPCVAKTHFANDSLDEVLLPVLGVDYLPVGGERAKSNVVDHCPSTDGGKVARGGGPVLLSLPFEGQRVVTRSGCAIEVSLKHPTLQEGAGGLELLELIHGDEPVVDTRPLIRTRLSGCACSKVSGR